MKEKLPESKAKRIRTLFTKQKKLLGHYYKAVEIKPPFLELMRNNGDVEFYEEATKGKFKFTHSSGEEREIYLIPSRQVRKTYLDKDMKGYICHEDNPLPLPTDPILTIETLELVVDKTLNDVRKWKAEEYEAKGDFVKSFVWIIVAVGIIYILYKLIVPQAPDPIPPSQAVETTAQIINATIIK